MSDSYGDPQQNQRNFNSRSGNFRGGRNSGNREGGGFRIRLSDNEMKAARALQEAFNLRSTVAVLGFALRALGEMLEEGKLNEMISQHQAQGHKNISDRNKSVNPTDGRDSRQASRENKKPNPFARPEKPSSSEPPKEESPEKEDKNKLTINDEKTDSDIASPESNPEQDENKQNSENKIVSDDAQNSQPNA